MDRIALQITPELVASVCQMMEIPENPDALGDSAYAIITTISSTEFNFKLVNEDEIVEAAKNDSDLQIISI